MSITVRPLHLAVGLVSFSRTVQAFQVSVCKKAFEDLIAHNETIIDGKSIYFTSSSDNLNKTGFITYDACRAVCGAGDNSIVSDCGPRLASWVLPVIILAGSVQQPPLAFGQRVRAILSMAGDPMGSLSRMIQELRCYYHCLDESIKTAAVLENHLTLIGAITDAAKDGSIVSTRAWGARDQKADQNLAADFARIFHGLSKARPTCDTSEISQYFRKAIAKMATLKPSKRTRVLVGFRNRVNQSGRAIVRHKSRSTPKSCFAVFWFLLPLVIAIVPEVSPPASGGMIASILTLSPLLLMVFLSNAIGEYSNLEFLEKELGKVRNSIPKVVRQKLKNPLAITVSKRGTGIFQSTHRPRTRRSNRVAGESGPLRWTKRRWFDGILPLVIFSLAIGSAGGAIGTAPTFFHERHIVLIMVFVEWLGSWGVTYWAGDKHRAERLVAAVHCMVATSVPILLAGMTCGLGGTCRSWTGFFLYGATNARIPLDLQETFDRNTRLVYPVLVSVCLGINLMAFAVLRYCIFQVPFSIITGDDSKIGVGELVADRGGQLELAELP